MTFLIVLALVALMFLGAPFFALIGAIALLGFHVAGNDLAGVVNEFVRIGELPVLVAIPLFTFAGYLLSESGAPKRLVRLADAMFGGIRGGIGIVALVACALFTMLTGASGVTIVALGAVLLPALAAARYNDRFNYGLLTTSGSLGMLFAPSLPLIIYAVVAQQLDTSVPVSIEDLFKAGLLPGLLMMLVLGAYAVLKAPSGATRERIGTFKDLPAALWDARYEIPLPFVVVLGVYFSWFAPSEAAAVSALYVLFITTVVRREIAFTALPRILAEASTLVGAILVILGMALALTNYLIDAEIPSKLFEFISQHLHNKWLFLLALNLFLMVFGMLLEGIPAIVILTPLILPIAQGFGLDPVHFGIMFVANLQIGLFLPPLGMNLYIASARFNKPVAQLIASTWPFFLLLLLCVLVITYVPWLSLVLLAR
jgi:tripartite ATP-independent transporter DctM subunit